MWALAAALAAGLLQDLRVLPVALFFLLRDGFVNGSRRRGLLLASLTGAVFWGYGVLATENLQRRSAVFESFAAAHPEGMVLAGWISSFPSHGFGRVSFELTTTLDGVRLQVLVSTREFVVAYGESIRVQSRPAAKRRSNGAYVRGRGCAGSIRAVPGGVEVLEGRGGNVIVRHVLAPLHEQIRRRTTAGVGARAGIPLALLIAERGLIDRRLRKTFIVLGISHLLALSGLHLGFVVGALVLAMRLLRRRSHWFLVAVLLLYVGTVGPVLSLQRALVMAVLLITAAGLHRPLRPMGALVHAFVLLLIVHPHAIHAVGFQLSFLATFAVLLCAQELGEQGRRDLAGRVWHFVRSSLWISVAVQLFLAPVILQYFGRISLVAPVATVIFLVPVAVMLFACASAALAALLYPAAGSVLFVVVDHLTEWFDAALVALAEAAPSPLELPVPSFVVFYCGLGVFWLARRKPWVRYVGLAICAAAFL